MTFVSGAASTAVRDLLPAPPEHPLNAVIAHVSGSRVGLLVGARLLVLDRAHHNGTLPCSIIVPRLVPRLFGSPGTAARLDIDGVHGGQQVRVTRWWDPAQVSLPDADSAPTIGRALAERHVLHSEVRAGLQVATTALLAGHAVDAVDALVGMLGRGAGSTPDADDAVAGLLLAARHDLASRRAMVQQVASAVSAAAPARTTVLSAELLRHVAQGRAAAAVVEAVCRPSAAAAAALGRLGSSSGAATAEGIDLLRRQLSQDRMAA